MFCHICGAKAIEGASFCRNCGTCLIINEDNTPVTQPAYPQMRQPVYEPVPPLVRQQVQAQPVQQPMYQPVQQPVQQPIRETPVTEKVFCRKCGTEMSDTADFCTVCGTKRIRSEASVINNIPVDMPLPDVPEHKTAVSVQPPIQKEPDVVKQFCRKCGAELSQDVEFCSKCGVKVIAANIPVNTEPKKTADSTVNIPVPPVTPQKDNEPPQEKVFCRKCGNLLPPEADFCKKCGTAKITIKDNLTDSEKEKTYQKAVGICDEIISMENDRRFAQSDLLTKYYDAKGKYIEAKKLFDSIPEHKDSAKWSECCGNAIKAIKRWSDNAASNEQCGAKLYLERYRPI